MAKVTTNKDYKGNKLFDINSLGADIVAGLDQGAINPGAAFLSGVQTTAFGIANMPANVANQVANMAAAPAEWAMEIKGKGETIYDAAVNSNLGDRTAQLMDAIGQQIETSFKDDLIPFSKDELKRLAEETTNAFSSYLVQRTAYWTAETSKKSVSDFLAELSSPIDDMLIERQKQQEAAQLSNALDKVKEVTSSINDAVGSTVSALNNGMDSILKFINAGPEFLESKINIYMNSLLVPAKKEITDKTNDIISWSYEQAENIARTSGTAAGDLISNKTQALASKQKANIEKAKITVLSFAKSALDLVQKKAMALIGM